MAPKANGKRKGSPCADALALAAETGASYQMMARCTNVTAFRATDAFRKLAEQSTPYGSILKHTCFETVDGPPVTLAYACPFAFLFYACESTPLLGFLMGALGAALLGRVVFFMDETKPGNPLRPNVARAMTGIFWGIADLPDWWRSKRAFWNVFAHVPTTMMHRIKGGASAVFLRMLEIFWSPDGHNFARLGVLVRGRLVRFRYGFVIVDEKAEKELFGLKGAGGMRMCASCLNCVRTEKRIDESNLVLFSQPDMTKFERNTPDLLAAALDHLALQHGVLNKTAFGKLEMMLGISYASCVVLYSSYRGMLNYPTSRFTDWFHDLLASGGVYQIIVNEVVLDIVEHAGLTLKDIDAFQAGVRLPAQPLGKTFFQDRIVERRGAHVKAFASETISAVQVVCFLFVCVFDNSAQFARQVRLCELARESLEVLLAGDSAVRLANRLDGAMEELQTIFLSLYPWGATPKLHLMRHIKDGLEHHRCNISCGGGERMHRRTKEFGRFAFRSFQDTILLRSIKSSVELLGRDSTYLHTELEGKPAELMVLGAPSPSWKRVRVGSKRIAAGDVVHFTALGNREFGRARGFVQHSGKVFASASMLSPMADGCFSLSALGERLVECAVLEGAAAYVELGPGVFKILAPLR